MIRMLIYNLLKYNLLKCKIDHYEPRLLKVLEDRNVRRQNTQNTCTDSKPGFIQTRQSKCV